MADPIIVTRQMVEETFDGAAPSYNSIWWFKECGQQLIDLLPIGPGANVLDIASGTGMVLLPAARNVGPKGHVTGIDLSSGMLQQAKRAVEINGLSNVNLIKMDAEHLEFPDASFDTITCGFGIWFLPLGAIREMYRVCKPGGTIGVTVFEKTAPDLRLPGQILSELARAYGTEYKYERPGAFTIDEVELFLAGYGFQPKKTLRETKKKVYANVESYWEIILSAATRVGVMSMDEGTRTRFKAEYIDKLKAVVQPDGLHDQRQIIYSIAQK